MPTPSLWRLSHALLCPVIGKLLPKQTSVDQSPQWNEGWENVIQTLLQRSHLEGLIAIHATYEKKPFIYFSQLLTSQLKGIPNCFWVLIQQIISAHFRKYVTMKYFGFIQNAHPHCCVPHIGLGDSQAEISRDS